MQKRLSPLMRLFIWLFNALLLCLIAGFCYYIIRFNDTFLARIPENYTSNQLLVEAFKYSALFTLILVLGVSFERYIKVWYLDTCSDKVYDFAISSFSIFMLIAIVFVVYALFFHTYEQVTLVEDREMKLPDQVITKTEVVYEEAKVTPLFPFDISGSEAVVIDASDGMQDFMEKFYNSNIPFFAQENRQIFILRDGSLELFDGDFLSITYSGNSSDIAEILSSLNYDTVWLFSNEMEEVAPQSTNSSGIIDKTLIIYSPAEIDISNLETYFTVVNGITVKDIK